MEYINQIIQGDCLEVMHNIPDNYIDLAVTSPPYNLGNNHHTGNNRHQTYEDNLPEDKYQQQQTEVLNEIFRITKTEGSLFYNHKNRIKNGVSITPYQWILESNWIIKQELVWFNGSQNFDKIRFYPMTERIYWLVKSPETKLFNAINHHDLFTTKEWGIVGTKGVHKRAFPIKMVKDILNCFPNAKVILDPYIGQGTIAIACKELGKKYIGIEISPKYYKLAIKKVNSISESLF